MDGGPQESIQSEEGAVGRKWAWAKSGPILGTAPRRHSQDAAPLGPAPAFRRVVLKPHVPCPDLTGSLCTGHQLPGPGGLSYRPASAPPPCRHPKWLNCSVAWQSPCHQEIMVSVFFLITQVCIVKKVKADK